MKGSQKFIVCVDVPRIENWNSRDLEEPCWEFFAINFWVFLQRFSKPREMPDEKGSK